MVLAGLIVGLDTVALLGPILDGATGETRSHAKHGMAEKRLLCVLWPSKDAIGRVVA